MQLALKIKIKVKEHVKTSCTSALLRSSVFRRQPRVKVVAPATVAHQERIHSPWASFTRFWKGNFIFMTTMAAAGRVRGLTGGRGEGERRGNERRCCAVVCERRRRGERRDWQIYNTKVWRSPTAVWENPKLTENYFVRNTKRWENKFKNS